MSALYLPIEQLVHSDGPSYPVVAPPSDVSGAYLLNQQTVGDSQPQASPQHGYQTSSNTVIVSQPHAPVMTYPVAQQSQHTRWAIVALLLSIAACCFCFPIALVAFILGSKVIFHDAFNPQKYEKKVVFFSNLNSFCFSYCVGMQGEAGDIELPLKNIVYIQRAGNRIWNWCIYCHVCFKHQYN